MNPETPITFPRLAALLLTDPRWKLTRWLGDDAALVHSWSHAASHPVNGAMLSRWVRQGYFKAQRMTCHGDLGYTYALTPKGINAAAADERKPQ